MKIQTKHKLLALCTSLCFCLPLSAQNTPYASVGSSGTYTIVSTQINSKGNFQVNPAGPSGTCTQGVDWWVNSAVSPNVVYICGPGSTWIMMVNALATTLSSLTTVGTITSGTWAGSVVGSTFGGTGVNNSATITLGSANHNYATLGTGIIKNTTGTGAFSLAAYTDVTTLWGGTCNSSTYMRGDGSCQTPAGGIYPGVGVANSTGSSWGTSFSVQGTDAKLLSSGTISGSAGTALCIDSNNGATTSGCASGGGSPGGVTGALQKNGGSSTFSGQSMIYSNIYGSGTERQLGNNCIPLVTIPYTAFTAAATSQQITVMTVPAWWFPQSILLSESTTFTSGSGTVTALAASIGTAGSPSYYVQPLPLMQATPNFKGDNVNSQPASLLSHNIVVQVSVTNAAPGNLGNGSSTNLTAGALQIAACGGTYQ